MLQALKLDPALRPAAAREREAGPDLQESAFAGYMANATSFARLTGPTPAAAAPPRREPQDGRTEARQAESRTDPSPERSVPRETTARTERAKPENRVEDARPKTQAQEPDQTPENLETPKAAESSEQGTARPTDLAQAEAVQLRTAVQAPTTTSAETGEALPQVQGLQGLTSTLETRTLKTASQRTPTTLDPALLTTSKAQVALEQAAPGVHLRFQFSEGAPAGTTSKPALTEFLSLPKPGMEIPKPLLNADRPSGATEKAPLNAAVQAAPIKAAELPTQALSSAVMITVAREASLSVSVKADTLSGKTGTPSSASIAAASPATSVKGTTPVPALESPQGAKANATFAQMDGTIRWLIKNQEKGAEIQLNPESLGRVVIKLRIEGGEVHARLWASEASTVPILQEQKAALEASLRQQGLNLGSFDLQQGRRGDDASSTSLSTRSGSGAGIAESREKKQDLPTVAPALLGGAHLIEVFA